LCLSVDEKKKALSGKQRLVGLLRRALDLRTQPVIPE
jgi:hypothetical protein